MPDSKEYVQISAAAKMLGVSIDTLRRWDKAGKISSVRLDEKNRYFKISELQALKEQQDLKTSDAAHKLGISVDTLLRYEKNGLITIPRNPHGERVYSTQILQQVEQIITRSKRAQVPIPETKTPYPYKTLANNSYFTSSPASLGSSFSPPSPPPQNSDPPDPPPEKTDPVFHSSSHFKKKALFALLPFLVLIPAVFITSNYISKDKKPTQYIQNKGKVLAASTQQIFGKLVFNIPTIFTTDVSFNGQIKVGKLSFFQEGLTVQNGDITVANGNVTAPNLIYSVTGGTGVTVTGGQNPVVSFSGVTSVGGQTGDITLAAGNGISIDGTTITNNDTGSGQKIFKTIKVGSDSFDAGNNTDTLTFAAGSNITLTTDKDNKKITIAAGGASADSGWTHSGTNIYTTVSTDKVGIGTSAPSVALDVTGDIRSSASFIIGGQSVSSVAGKGLDLTSGTLGVGVLSAADGTTGTTSSFSGFEFAGPDGNQLSLLQGCSDGELLKWDAASNTWMCASDQGGSTGVINVKNGATSYTSVDTINFETPDFSVTKTGNEAQATIDYTNSHIVRSNQSETIASAWTFSSGLSGTTINATTGIQTGGITRIDASGNLTNIGTTQLNTITYTWPGSDGQSGSFLTTDGSGKLDWATTSSINFFQRSGGSISPLNITDDFNLGNTATTSALVHLPGTTNQNAFFNIGTGNLGVGISNPTHKLEVSGTLAATGDITFSNLGAGVVHSDGTGNLSVGTVTNSELANSTITVSGGTGLGVSGSPVALGGTIILSNTGVTSFQGSSGAITLNPGSGIGISGTTISNNGVTSFQGNTGAITLSNGTGISISGTSIGVTTSVPTSVNNDTNVTGSISSNILSLGWSGQLAPSRGGTGISSYTAGDLLYASNSTTLGTLAAGPGNNGKVLTVSGGLPVWSDAGSAGISLWQKTLGSLSPLSSSDDIVTGSTATSSALVKLPGTTNQDAFFNLGTGNLGIGTRNPTHRLDVSGTGNISGAVTVGSTLGVSGNTTLTGDLAVNGGNITSTGILTIIPGSTLEFFSTANSLTTGGDLTLAGTVTGTTLNGTTGINTGASTGTVRIDVNGNLKNIGTTEFAGTTYTWPNPASLGSNLVLTTDGTGALTWKTVSGAGGNSGTITAVGNETTGDAFTALGTTSTSLYFANSGFHGQLTIGTLSGNQTYTLPNQSGTVCLTSGNCSGSGGGVTTSGGTTNFIPKFTGSQVLSDSSIFDNGNVGIGTSTPGSFKLNVTGNTNITGTLTTSGTINGASISGGTLSGGSVSGGTYTSSGLSVSGNYTATIGNTNSFSISDGSNSLFTVSDAGTVGNLSNIGTINASGTIVSSNIASGATVSGTNTGDQNVFSSITDGTNSVTADSLSQALTLISTGATSLAYDPANHKITISSTDTNSGGTITAVGNETSGAAFTSGGTTSNSLYFANSGFHGLLTIGTLTGDHTYTLPNATGTICLTSGNCASSGGGVTTAGGTPNFIPKFSGAQTLADSTLFNDINGNLGIGTSTPGEKLDVNGNILIQAAGSIDTRAVGSLSIGTTTSNALTLGKAGGTFTINSTSWTATPTISGLITATGGLTANGLITGAAGVTVNSGQNLTLAGITGNNQILFGTASTGVVAGVTTTSTTGQCLLSGSSAPSWGGCPGGGVTSNWTINNGALYPMNSTLDLLLGGTASTSAKFAFINNIGNGTPTASISGSLANVATYLTGDGTLSTTNMQPLTLGSLSTGSIQLSPKGTTGLFVNGSGNVGIGSTTPGYLLDVNGAAHVNGELYLAGQTSSSSTTEGTLYYNSTDKQLYVYENGKWQADRSTATIIVAAPDSKNKNKADFVTDGQGGTDDTTTLNSALAALPSSGSTVGGTLVLMDGTYYLNSQFQINKSNVNFVGVGKATKLIRNWNGGNGVVNISASKSNVKITDMEIDGQKATYTSSTNFGIWFNTSVTRSTIQNIYLHDTAGPGIQTGSSGNSQNTIENNTLVNTGTSTLGGAIVSTGTYNIISNNTIDGAYDGILSEDTYGTISNNTISTSTHNGIDTLNGDQNKIIGNTITTSGREGIFITGQDYDTISNNFVYGNGTAGTYSGIYLVSGNNSVISGNTVYDNTGEGMLISTDNNTITGNSVMTNGSRGIYLYSGASKNTVSSNSVANNTADGISTYNGSNYNEIIGNSISSNGGNGINITSFSSNNIVQNNTIYDNSGTGSSDGILIAGVDNNTITGNTITDTAGTGFAIHISAGGTGNYIANNTYSGTGASSVSIVAGNTYAGQVVNSSGDYAFTPTGNVGIGTTAPEGFVTIKGGSSGGNAALIVNQTGASTNDLFVASASGTLKFKVTNGGSLNLAGGQTSDIDTLTNTTLKIGASNATSITLGRSNQTLTLGGYTNGGLGCGMLTTDTSGVLTCSAAPTGGSGSSSPWQDLAGAISPITSTNDFLLGGSATSSALIKFPGNNNQDAYFNLGTGKLGVGTKIPIGILDVDGNNGTVPSLVLANNAKDIAFPTTDNLQIGTWDNVGQTFTELLRLQNDGNLGIGTTTANAKLDVNGNILLQGGGTIDTRAAGTLTIGGTTQTGLTLGRSGQSTTLAGNVQGFTLAGNIAGSGTQNITSINGFSGVTGVFSASATTPVVYGGTTASSGLSLQSTSGAGTSDFIKFLVGNNGATEAMRINTSGNLGIGTSTPSSFKLQVAGSIGPNADNTYSLGASSSARFKDLFLGPGSAHIQCTTGDGCGQNLDFALGVNTATNNFYLGANGRAGALNELLSINPDTHNVGIGVTNPGAVLSLAANTIAKPQLHLTSSTGTDVSSPTSGDLWWNGTNLNFSDGSTTTDLLATGGSALWSQTGSNIYYNTGNVGIGTSTPNEKLSVNGKISLQETSAPSNTSGYGKLYASSSDHALHYVNNSGSDTNLSQVKQLIQNYVVDTGKSVSAGDVVSYINGHIARVADSVLTTSGNPVTFDNSGTSGFNASKNLDAATIDSSRFVIAYVDQGSSDNGYAIVGSISGTTITYGTASRFNASATTYVSVVALSSSNFAVAYSTTTTGSAIIANVTASSTTISSWGTASTFYSGSVGGTSITSFGANNFTVGYSETGVSYSARTRTAATSGTTISSWGLEAVANGANSNHVSVTALSSTVLVTSYVSGSSAYAKIGTTSGTSISYSGSAYSFDGNTPSMIQSTTLSSSSFALVLSRTSQALYSIIGTVSGTVITFGSETAVGGVSSVNFDVATLDSTHIVIAYANVSPNNIYSIIGTISGTSVTFGSNTAQTTSGNVGGASVAAISSTQFVVAYQDFNSGAFQYYGIAETGNTKQGPILGIAKTSGNAGDTVPVIINGVSDVQSGLTAGSTYYIDDQGNLTTTSTSNVAGLAISSTELQLNNNTDVNQYFGDAIFANNFRITEAPGSPQGLIFKNQLGENILNLDEFGNLSVNNSVSAGSITTQGIQYSDFKIVEDDNNLLTIGTNPNDGTSNALFQLDQFGNATFSGTLTAQNINAQNGTIGTLHVNNLIADNISSLNNESSSTFSAALDTINAKVDLNSNTLASVSAELNKLEALNLAPFMASDSADTTVTTINNGLLVMGTTSLNDVSANSLTIGTTMKIDGTSINSLGETLSIEPLQQADVDIMGGAVVIKTDGTLHVAQNAEFAKDVKIQGVLSANTIQGLNGTLNVSGSATLDKVNLTNPGITILSDTEVSASGSAGLVILKNGQTQLKITDPKVTDNSLIFLTPKTETDAPLFIKQQVNGQYFIVGIKSAPTQDIQFNFLIVN